MKLLVAADSGVVVGCHMVGRCWVLMNDDARLAHRPLPNPAAGLHFHKPNHDGPFTCRWGPTRLRSCRAWAWR
jgi:hypothetical protein